MKCDKLQARTIYVDCLGRTIVYFDPYEVNEAVKELKQKLQDQCISCPVKMQEDDVVAELKQKLEDAKSTAYTESVDAGMENRRLKRALWLARAERAVAKQAYYDILSRGISSERGEMYDMWNNVERKCRAKAEEYK